MGIIFDSENSKVSGTPSQELEEGSESSNGSEEATEEYKTLPDSFFSRITQRQKAYVEILLEADGWLSNEEIRRQLEDDYDLNCGGPQAISGIRSGFTRKYGKGFSVDERDWMGDQNQYRLNEQYREEIEEYWN
ncbi:hypothetical protein C475_19578 [Halosimplex carlsbadense 2-9-1]|uniref:Uncharacterized protein n=2 Tax=Halosimplex carlsbadense TaxID=171164 RepID=M0CDV4_9EURY|nr:hypothetical protein C475_19578 [Halosimplex carlsbadense 2-9-1]